MDNLEKYIIENRELWDDEKASNLLWDRIENEIGHDLNKDKGTRSNWLQSLLAIIAISILGIAIYLSTKQNPRVEPAKVPLEFAETDNDFHETEHFYLTSINMEFEELSKHNVNASLLDDLSQLDSIDRELREEYQKAQNGYKEQILHALIVNHQTKLGLLQKVLEDINKYKNEKDELY